MSHYDLDQALQAAFEAAAKTDPATVGAVNAARHLARDVREQFAGQDLRLVGQALLYGSACTGALASCGVSMLVVNVQALAGALVIDQADREAGR